MNIFLVRLNSYSSLFAVAMLFTACVGSGQVDRSSAEKITPNCPQYINLGEVDNPVFSCVRYVGFYEFNGRKLGHIQGFEYSQENEIGKDTIYYEDTSKIELKNIANFLVSGYPGNGTIKLKHGLDSLIMFRVLESNKFITERGDYQFRRMPTISRRFGHYASDMDVRFDYKKVNDSIYKFTFLSDFGIESFDYICPINFRGDSLVLSYLNLNNAKIHSVIKGCVLEPKEKINISKKIRGY